MAEETFRFLDLPPEIRDEIYKLLLPGDLQLTFYKYRHAASCYRYERETILALTRLIQTNQQINKEVAPVLYGTATLCYFFNEPSVSLIRSMGSMNEHIRHVYIDGWTKSSVRSGLHQLKQAKYLQTITLSNMFRDTRNRAYYQATRVAESMRPFLKEIRKHKTRKGLGDDIVDSVFVGERTHPFWTAERVEEEKLEHEKYTTALRSELKRLLM